MESTFTPLRIGILVVLLAVFALCGGFELPRAGGARDMRIWTGSVAMFVIGAVMVSIVDHWVGNLDRSNLRWLYVVMGILGMSGSLLYRHVLGERLKIGLGVEEAGP